MKSIIKTKSIQFIVGLLVCLALVLFPTLSLAHRNSYPVNSRSVFLTGCLLNDSPNFQDDDEVKNTMQGCVCMLDKFQNNYTNLQFMRLFAGADQNEQPYVRELNNFVNRHAADCI